MTVQKLKGITKEVAGGFYLFTSLVCLLIIGLHFIMKVDTQFETLARVIETIKSDPFAFLNGGNEEAPNNFSNFKIILKLWLLQF